eukprot:1150027-Pelagomonas_calceolata.AAC.2
MLPPKSGKLARKLHSAHSVMYANKLVITRRAIENTITFCSQVMEPAPWWRGFKALLSQCVPFPSIDVGRVFSAYVVFLFFLTSSRADAVLITPYRAKLAPSSSSPSSPSSSFLFLPSHTMCYTADMAPHRGPA